ncbi:MAG TPA: mandelate racemase/muconate lactonizing enzyme family protein [Verrucomicrobiae bacterium]|nr:mandelate racemase/muconate lactonizing enzyme family protein [Verrucomicrobiae bacterium]
MKIESVDFFYLSMPVVTDAGDGSQDALVVRVRAGGIEAWGECEASPLTSIASFVCPMSHGACRPVGASILGEDVSTPADIARIAATIQWNSMDLLQAAHTWSGVEIALWDLLGKKRGEPVYKLLGYQRAYPKTPYASQLFGDTAQQTLEFCRAAREAGYRAVKCGWGPFGRGSVKEDADHLVSAREGIGPEGLLLIDAGQIWGEDVAAAEARLSILEQVKATWLEEPFNGSAYEAYGALAKRPSSVKLAGGEAAHNIHMARHTIDIGKVGYIQIDCGRIGGIGPAKQVADYAVGKGVTYVNHTFTSHLALCASIQPFAGLSDHRICEYPVKPQPMAWEMCKTHIAPDANGEVRVPEAPGLGMEMDRAAMKKYLIDAEIAVGGKVLYRTPSLD